MVAKKQNGKLTLKIQKTKKPKRILVTGAAGFMGSHLVDYLLAQGHKVYGVDDLSGGYRRNVNPKSIFTRLDLFYQDSVRIYIEHIKPEVIFHLAADATEGRSQFTPLNCSQRNLMAYLNVLIPSIRTGVEKVVLTSSMSVYGNQKPPFSEDMEPNPVDVYGINKASMEKITEVLADVHGFKYTVIRPHNVYGPRQNLADPYRNVIGIFINCLLNNKNFYIYGDGEQKRAFTYIDDFTPYIAKAAFSKSCDGEVINVGPREEYSINAMAAEVLNNFFDGAKDVPEHLKPKYVSDRPREVKEAYCTETKAHELLGYKTTVSLKDGIRRMVEWSKTLGAQKPAYMEELEIENKHTPKTWIDKLI